jgi:hypothetical protein
VHHDNIPSWVKRINKSIKIGLTDQKDRHKKMGGQERRKQALNAEEAPCLPRKLAMRGGDHR